MGTPAFYFTAHLLVVNIVILVLRLRRPWRLQENRNFSPVCRILEPDTWSSLHTHQTPERLCGLSNQRNVSHVFATAIRFTLWLFLVQVNQFYHGNNVCSLSCSYDYLGRSPCTSCCCPRRCLEEDFGLHGNSSEAVNYWQSKLLKSLEMSQKSVCEIYIYIYIIIRYFMIFAHTLLRRNVFFLEPVRKLKPQIHFQ